jgi:two-component system, sensor histidine kinase and response regulator
MPKKPEILIVDDKEENLFALEMLLKRLEVKVFRAENGDSALALALEHDFCVAIVDIQMPEMDGYELVEYLRSNSGTAHLPAIFVSAIYSDEYHHRKGYDAGAVDFLSKPFNPEILISKVKVFIDLYQQRRALEEEVEQRRQAEQALKIANLTLEKLNIDKDRFLSIISHDLRGPFNVILGNAQLLAYSVDRLSPEDIQDMANSLFSGAKSAYDLLENLLTWARMQREGGMQCHPESLELAPLMAETLDLLRPVANQKEILLNSSVPQAVCVQVDRQMLRTVVRNLVSNAIKFTQRGGSVTLAVSQDGSQALAGFASVTVQDSGVGMSPADQNKLFRINLVHSTPGTEEEKGSGLGLLICKEMVEKNGGKIWVESELGRGTSIKFTVPLVRVPQPG